MPVSSIPGVGLIPSAAKNANGSTNARGLTVRGVPMTSTQQKVAERLLGVCDQKKAGSIASEAIIFASIAESNLGENMGPSSAGYVGALQGNTSYGFTTSSVEDEAAAFLDGGKGYQGGGALSQVRNGATDPIAIAVTVEVPDGGQGYGYSREAGYDGPGWLAESKAIVAGVGGMAVKGGVAGLGGTGTVVNGSPGSTYKFQIGGTDNPDEDFWTGCNRLASEVGWYFFTNGEMLYYMDGQEMIAQKPALYLDRVRDAGRLTTPLSLTWDNTAFNATSDHKRRFTTQRKTALVKMTSPTQVMFDLICGIDEIRAGDVIVLTSFGPGDGRWIVGDCQRSVFATYSSITLVPPIAPMSEVAVAGATGTSSATGTSTAAASPGGVALAGTLRAKVVQVARAAIARQAKSGAYQYQEVRPYPNSLFGPAPIITDCSGFSILCYKDAGAPDPNGTGFNGEGFTGSLVARGTKVQTPQPADLVFYNTIGINSHVAVYLGNGQIANMGSPGEPVQESLNAPGPIYGIRSFL